MSRAMPNYIPNMIQQGLLNSYINSVPQSQPLSSDAPRDIESKEDEKVENVYIPINPRVASMIHVRRNAMKRDK
jgi:hypothetical protein